MRDGVKSRWLNDVKTSTKYIVVVVVVAVVVVVEPNRTKAAGTSVHTAIQCAVSSFVHWVIVRQALANRTPKNGKFPMLIFLVYVYIYEFIFLHC